MVKTSDTYRPRFLLTSITGCLRKSRAAGNSQVGSKIIVTVRRVILRIGSTLFPLDKNKVRVPTSTVLLCPNIRPDMNSLVSAVHNDLYGIKSPVRLSNSITAGAVNNSASNNFRHSSSSAGNARGFPFWGVAKAVNNSQK